MKVFQYVKKQNKGVTGWRLQRLITHAMRKHFGFISLGQYRTKNGSATKKGHGRGCFAGGGKPFFHRSTRVPSHWVVKKVSA